MLHFLAAGIEAQRQRRLRRTIELRVSGLIELTNRHLEHHTTAKADDTVSVGAGEVRLVQAADDRNALRARDLAKQRHDAIR
jgi:hypothetical protein